MSTNAGLDDIAGLFQQLLEEGALGRRSWKALLEGGAAGAPMAQPLPTELAMATGVSPQPVDEQASIEMAQLNPHIGSNLPMCARSFQRLFSQRPAMMPVAMTRELCLAATQVPSNATAQAAERIRSGVGGGPALSRGVAQDGHVAGAVEDAAEPGCAARHPLRAHGAAAQRGAGGCGRQRAGCLG